MPISTQMAKSGLKKVVKKQRSNVPGGLNRAARSVSRAEADHLTPGVVTELFDRTATRGSKKKQQAIIENRRRRH